MATSSSFLFSAGMKEICRTKSVLHYITKMSQTRAYSQSNTLSWLLGKGVPGRGVFKEALSRVDMRRNQERKSTFYSNGNLQIQVQR